MINCGGRLIRVVLALRDMRCYMDQNESSSIRIRFTTRALLLLTFVCAAVTASCVYLHNATRQRMGFGPYASFDEWPRALIDLIGDDAAFHRDVQPFGLGQFIDHRSIWRIRRGSPLRDRLFGNNELESTNSNHPKAAELIASAPAAWGKHSWDRCAWHATPGYGTRHIEGVDLYLVAEDPDTGELIVLHEWIF